MRVWRVLLWTLGLTLLATPPVAATVPTDLRFLAPILGQLTPDVPVRLHVPQQVMTVTRPGLPDLRLFDDQGLETPYVIISGRVGSTQAAEHVYDRTTIVQPGTRTDAQGNTLVLLGRVHLRIAQVTLAVDNPYYHRHAELWAADTDTDDAYRQVASGTIYKLPGMAAADTTLHVSSPSTYAYVRLKILNNDNPPLRLQQVELAWVRQHLYFIPAAGRHYTLYFGAEKMRAPVYELQRLLPAQHAKLAQYAAVSLGDVQPHPHYQPRPSQDSKQGEKTLLTVGVLVLAGALGLWAYRLLKTVTRVGT